MLLTDSSDSGSVPPWLVLQLYGGLLVFVGYILFDTQMIVEQASQGNMDYIRHALDLFVDFVAILIRLLVILVRPGSWFVVAHLGESAKHKVAL